MPAGSEPLPLPDAWTKQLGFWSSQDERENGGMFWCDRFPRMLQESSWESEVELGMAAIGAR